ncbi:unnamed protein product [Ixodes pacificus]
MMSSGPGPRNASLSVYEFVNRFDAEDVSTSEDSDQDENYKHEDYKRPDYRGFYVLVSALVAFMLGFILVANGIIGLSGGKLSRPKITFNATRALGCEKKPYRILVCTQSTNATRYPRDGLCDIIVFTHVLYDNRTGSLHSKVAPNWGWSEFLHQTTLMTQTRLLPSHDWKVLVDSIDVNYARGLNKALVRHRLGGLALFNVRVNVAQLPGLIGALRLLHEEDSRMFLGLGVMFEGLSDETASSLLPTDLFDELITPLRLFVLETHLPVPCRDCYTGLSAPLNPYGNPRQPFSMIGAERLLAHRALAYVNTTVLVRCLSVLSGVLVFDVASESSEPGAPCLGWSVNKLSEVCKVPNIRHHVDAQSAYGHTNSTFFTFESTKNMVDKVLVVLQRTLDSDLPACLAVYGLDLDDTKHLCPRTLERTGSFLYTATEVLCSLRGETA